MDWVGEVTTVVGTLGGAGVGVRGALAISRNQRDEARRQRIGDAYSAFLAAVVLAVAELRQWPSPTEPHALRQLANRTQDKICGEGTSDLAARRGARAIFGDRPWIFADGVVQAWAVLRVLPLDDDTRSVCDSAVDYVERLSDARTDEIKAEWSGLHARLMDAANQISGNRTPQRRPMTFGSFPAPTPTPGSPETQLPTKLA
jgi:hypothetical protein